LTDIYDAYDTTTIPLSFTNEDLDSLLAKTPHVATIEGDDDSSEGEDGGSEAGSRGSVSDYTGPAKQAPGKMLFGPTTCRAIYVLSSDKGGIERVCGRKVGTCTRAVHGVLAKASEGIYDTIASRKYVDGVLSTHLPIEEFEALEKERKGKTKTDLEDAADWLRGLGESPSGSEEAAYYAAFDGEGMGSPKKVGMKTRSAGVEEWQKEGKERGLEENVKQEAKGEVKKKVPPTVHTDDGMLKDDDEYENYLMKSPTIQKIAKKGSTEMVMIGLMDRLAESVSESNVRLVELEAKTMEKAESNISDNQVAKVLGSLERIAGRLERLETAQGAYKSTAKDVRMNAPRSNKDTREGNREEWYGVAKGKDGPGIYRSWAVTSTMVLGHPNAVFQKFGSFEEAQEFVEDYQKVQVQVNTKYYVVFNEQDETSGIYENSEKASKHVNNVSGARLKRFKSIDEAEQYLMDHRETYEKKEEEKRNRLPNQGVADFRLGPDGGDGRRGGSSGAMVTPDRSQPTRSVELHAGPPPTLIGTDPSMKEADEIFGKDLTTGETELRAELCPPGMTEHIAKGLMNAVVDVVALPGGLSGSSIGTEDSNEIGLIGEALEELTHQGRSGTVDTVGRADLQWRNGKRTSLRTIKNEDVLRKRFGILIKL
jgi:hypothetical protein